jgi:hypothetical protein
MMDIGERLSRLEDRAELQDLIAKYFLAADGDDIDGLRAAFAANATFAVSGSVGGEGRDGIVAFLVEQRHYSLFTLKDSDHAEGLVGAHIELVLNGEAIYGAVRYADVYVRQDGAWRISRRDMRTIQLARWDELSTAFASSTPVRWPGANPAASEFPRSAPADA